MKLLINIILRILSIIPKDKKVNGILFYPIVKGVVFSDNRFTNLFVAGADKHFRILGNLLNGFLSGGGKLFHFLARPFYQYEINDVAKRPFGIGCPKYFQTHWLYFFITSSWGISFPLLAWATLFSIADCNSGESSSQKSVLSF